jgi:predicted DNA-binding transcriptional regulator AlpA
MPDDNGPIRFVRRRRILEELGIDPSTLDLWVLRGIFPTPYVLNPGQAREIIGFDEAAYEEWKRTRPQRRAKPSRKTPYPRGIPPRRKPKPLVADDEEPAEPAKRLVITRPTR